ncbi:major cardiolipin synthase ClsA [Oxobacter pfennigii]|uniref:Cardiolipin synthase n=1 Tax=Oxobacter pfennigii TaxID=36849 RepID=A0A0P8YEG5_9CLOT|nr:cardiolipin synthase [Oxobacter pfennigii]KPU45602.1 major cardiolipin synthase ClsA [Oxobacter pfennigii]
MNIFTELNVISVLFAINAIVSIVVIALERKRPEKSIAWILIFILLPPLGLILYLFLGRNWKRKRNILGNSSSDNAGKYIPQMIKSMETDELVPLVELLINNSESPLFVQNDITIFKDGNEKFKCLKEELLKAEHHIHLEYYIVSSDEIGSEIKDILIKKAKEGVKIRFIMDRVGSIRLKKKYIRELKEAGVDVGVYSYFLAPILRTINTQINYRNHRKIVVIDGKVGFVGGINIGDEYLGKGRLGYWRDIHIMVKGDFVLGLQAVFLDDYWTVKHNTNLDILSGEDQDKYCPEFKNKSGKTMQLVKSGPNSEFPSIMQSIFKMITMAKHHIFIATPYFIPSESIMEALKIALLSGIEVVILFPANTDHITVKYASRTYLQEIARYGAKIYFYNKNAFLHSKVITIDSRISNIGTANMDIRSFELNYEVNAVIYDEETTITLEKIMIEDIKDSTLMTYEDFEKVSKIERFLEACARLFSSLL